MQRQDKRFDEILELLMKQQKEDDKIRQEWSKISIHGYNPFALRERTQQLLNGGFYSEVNVNKLPGSLLFNYDPDKKNLADYEKLYLPLPEPPATLSAAAFNRTNDGLGSSVVVWVAAILVMVTLVFIIRTAEKCLEKRLFKVVRRASEEWPTPSVIATSQQSTNNGELGLSLRVDIPAFQPENQDLPPPYTDCTDVNDPANIESKYLEEPPPPYAACFVAFSAPKDDVPSVHIVNDRHQKAGTSGSDDNTENDDLTRVELGARVENVSDGTNENIRIDVSININDTNNAREHLA